MLLISTCVSMCKLEENFDIQQLKQLITVLNIIYTYSRRQNRNRQEEISMDQQSVGISNQIQGYNGIYDVINEFDTRFYPEQSVCSNETYDVIQDKFIYIDTFNDKTNTSNHYEYKTYNTETKCLLYDASYRRNGSWEDMYLNPVDNLTEFDVTLKTSENDLETASITFFNISDMLNRTYNADENSSKYLFGKVPDWVVLNITLFDNNN